MNRLLDAGAADEAHPLADLVATLGELNGDYDALHYPATDVAPKPVLHALMDQHGLRQSELAQELGSQGVVSEILSGASTQIVATMKTTQPIEQCRCAAPRSANTRECLRVPDQESRPGFETR